jgi:queuine/archaeosine tRNA-ribosyltransferase
MKTRDELKKDLKEWMKATIRTTADSAGFQNRRFSDLSDMARDISVAFKIQFSVNMTPEWAVKELRKVMFTRGAI